MTGISINDLRKNLRDINDHMDRECAVVRGALRHHARRLAHHRHRPAAGGRVRAGRHQHGLQPGFVRTSAWRRPRADQKIVQSKRAVEIETLKAQAEVEPLVALADQLTELKTERRRRARRLRAQRAAEALQRSQNRDPGGQP